MANVNCKTIKPLGDDIGQNIGDLRFGDELLFYIEHHKHDS